MNTHNKSINVNGLPTPKQENIVSNIGITTRATALLQGKTLPLTIDILQRRNKFLQSNGLPENQYQYSDYFLPITATQSLLHDGFTIDKVGYSFRPTQTDKKDFINPNIGWKIHLNVNPSNTREVTAYLIKQKYYHKFLSGGEIEDGKVYTIYIGSKHLTDQCAKSIYFDIGKLLAIPRSVNEIEFESGIVGRFVAMNGKYHQYGDIGLVYSEAAHRKLTAAQRNIRLIKRINSTNISEAEFQQVKVMLQRKEAFFSGSRLMDIGNCCQHFGTYKEMLAFLSKEMEFKQEYDNIKNICINESFNSLKQDYGTYFTG